MTTAREALERLREGNRRFVTGRTRSDASANAARRNDLVGGQTPFAVILGCSDSRVPVEIVFDQGLGDLFVIRVAGNIVAPSQIASVEFAADRFGTELVVVLGHSGCGAVQATLEAPSIPSDDDPTHLPSILERVRPALESARAATPAGDPEALLAATVRANVRASVERLRHGSAVLEERIAGGRLRVVGAEYSLETGFVDFFEGATTSA